MKRSARQRRERTTPTLEANPPALSESVAAVLSQTPTVDPPAPPRRRGRPKGSVNGTGPWSGRDRAKRVEASASPQARATAALILEGLTGLRSAPRAAEALGVSLPRYYVVEARAVAGLIRACEPAAPGPAPGAADERELERLRQTHRRQDQELTRLRAVLRSAERTLGLPPASASTPTAADAQRRKARRPVVRALTVVRRLMAQGGAAPTSSSPTVAPNMEADSTNAPSAATSVSGPVGG